MSERVIEVGAWRGGNSDPLGRRCGIRRRARVRFARDRQRVERREMRCERPEEAIGIVALEHAEDEVQWPALPVLGGNARQRLARCFIVRSIEPQLPAGRKTANEPPAG